MRHLYFFCLLVPCGTLAWSTALPSAAEESREAKTLFNGKDLTGWKGDKKLWSMKNGELVGKTDGLKRNEFIFSELDAGNFDLTVQIKLVDNRGNSGIQFRSEPLPDGEALGYQADVGPEWWGKLYEESGRGLLSDKLGEEYVKKNEWNEYRIVANGSHIQTWINNKPCADVEDPKGKRRGRFAFQLHWPAPQLLIHVV
jgi:hypothetical protein